jgi:hypothetical protein
MSDKQFEENLNYGDSVNLFGRIRDIFVSVAELKKELTKE